MPDGDETASQTLPRRPMREKHGLGLFCCVCLSRGESRENARFDDRETLAEHWKDEHW